MMTFFKWISSNISIKYDAKSIYLLSTKHLEMFIAISGHIFLLFHELIILKTQQPGSHFNIW